MSHKAIIPYLVVCVVLALVALGCSSGETSDSSHEARYRYGEKLDVIKAQIDSMGSTMEGELRAIAGDSSLSQEQKTARIVAILNQILAKIDSYAADLQKTEPPSDLAPLHKFFLSDLQCNRSIYVEFRDALKSGDQAKLNGVGQRLDSFEREHKDKLREAWWESGLSSDGPISSLKDAIARRKLGTGVRIWGLPINSWLIFAWFAMACIATSNKRIWQAARRGDLPPGDEEPPGWLGWIVIPQYAAIGYLAYLDWQQAVSVFVLTFLVATFLSLIMELIGAILLIPFVLIYKSVSRRK